MSREGELLSSIHFLIAGLRVSDLGPHKKWVDLAKQFVCQIETTVSTGFDHRLVVVIKVITLKRNSNALTEYDQGQKQVFQTNKNS